MLEDLTFVVDTFVEFLLMFDEFVLLRMNYLCLPGSQTKSK